MAPLVAILLLPALLTQTADQKNPSVADRFYQTAKSAKNSDEAMAAVKKALEYDAEHVGANLLLAELLIDKGQLGPAVAQFTKVQSLVEKSAASPPVPDASPPVPGPGQRPAGSPDDPKTQLAELEQKLNKIRWTATRWSDLKKQYAERYKGIGEGATGAGLPSTLHAFRKAAALLPRDAQLAALAEGAAVMAAKLPTPVERPDPEGAALLRTQAADKSKAGQDREALDLLETALSLDGGSAEAWNELAQTAIKQKNESLAAAALVRAKGRLANVKDADAARKLELQIKAALDRIDPQYKKVEETNLMLALEARNLAERAAVAGDAPLAAEIEATLKAMGLARVQPAKKAEPENLAKKLNLASEAVRIEALPGTRVAKLRDYLMVTPDPTAKPPQGGTFSEITAGVTLQGLTFSDDARIRWRVEPTKPKDRGRFRFRRYPWGLSTTLAPWDHISLGEDEKAWLGGNAWPREGAKRSWENGMVSISGRTEQPLFGNQYGTRGFWKDVFREDGIYEFGVDKLGDKVSYWLGNVQLGEFQMTPLAAAELRKASISLMVSQAKGQLGFKLSVVELVMGKKLEPWQPPDTQPADDE